MADEHRNKAELAARADGQVVPLDGRGEPARSTRADVVRRASGLAERAGGLFSGLTPSAVVRALPDVVKVTGALVWRTNRWTITASMHIGDVMIRGAVSGQSAASLIEQLSAEAKQSLRELLGVSEVPDPMPQALRERLNANGSRDHATGYTLAERLDALLDASSDLTYSEIGHPAYVRLLSELSPDEARILRLFAQRGAQPSVDVRTRRPFGVGSELVAPGITMIGRYAGCRDVDRVPAYLNNLFRLGLVWFSREALPEQSLYDVLEAQEEVEEAMARAGKGVTVRRSIELTAFGRNLCAMTGLLPESEGVARASSDQTSRQAPPSDGR
ncbi:MAG TPA: Abi-alpha family protein [Pseudonocardia sp.]|jgi:hypothetical protein